METYPVNKAVNRAGVRRKLRVISSIAGVAMAFGVLTLSGCAIFSGDGYSTDPLENATAIYLPDSGLAQSQSLAKISDRDWALGFTKAEIESAGDQTVYFTRTKNAGKDWSKPVAIEANVDRNHPSGWIELAYIEKSRLLFAFYFWNETGSKIRDGTDIYYRISADEGESWGERHRVALRDLDIFSGASSRHGWFMDGAITTSADTLVLGVSLADPDLINGNPDRWRTEVYFLRIPNVSKITEDTPPYTDLTPHTPTGLSLPHPVTGLPFANEPSVAELEDRLVCIARSRTGVLSFTQSFDDGVTWSDLEPLRFYDGGPPLLHPNGPATIRTLASGDVAILFNDNPGGAAYVKGKWSEGWEPRYPLKLIVARQTGARANAGLEFGMPEILLTYLGKPGAGTLRYPSYPELMETADGLKVFYSMDKAGLYFKRVPPELLERAAPFAPLSPD